MEFLSLISLVGKNARFDIFNKSDDSPAGSSQGRVANVEFVSDSAGLLAVNVYFVHYDGHLSIVVSDQYFQLNVWE